jgi:hypothetical protein
LLAQSLDLFVGGVIFIEAGNERYGDLETVSVAAIFFSVAGSNIKNHLKFI